jgi:hypothetical protein
LFASYQELVGQGWHLDVIVESQPASTDIALPVVALRSPHSGPALWLISGIHGEEPAGPNAISNAIDDIAALGKQYPVVLLPLLNPHGYVRNWRYLNVPVYSATIEGQSVGDSSHVLPDPNNPGAARARASSDEAAGISRYILKMLSVYPPRYSIDLHEDNLVSEGYVYSQGVLGAADPFAAEAVKVFRDNNIGVRMSGKTRFNEEIVDGIIGPVVDSSIDEFMSADLVIDDGRKIAGPGASTVLVFETPAENQSLEQRVDAHVQLIRRVLQLIGGQ